MRHATRHEARQDRVWRIKTPCTIRDLSVTGAALEVSEFGKIPATFNLIMPEDRLKLACRVVWRRDYRLGVAFE